MSRLLHTLSLDGCLLPKTTAVILTYVDLYL